MYRTRQLSGANTVQVAFGKGCSNLSGCLMSSRRSFTSLTLRGSIPRWSHASKRVGKSRIVRSVSDAEAGAVSDCILAIGALAW